MLARLADAPPGPPALLLVADTEAEWGERTARIWAHSGFTVLLVLRPPPAGSPSPASSPNPTTALAQPPPATIRPSDELPRWETRLRAHLWTRDQAPPLWLVTRETLPEVAALARAGDLPARNVVAIDGPPVASAQTTTATAAATAPQYALPVSRPFADSAHGRWWSPAWSVASGAENPSLAALRSLGWTSLSFPAGSAEDAFDNTVRLGRARIAADTLRAAVAPSTSPSHPPPLTSARSHAPTPEPIPTLHLTLRRLLTLGCLSALGLALWAGWRSWRTARPSLTRGSLALLGGGLWLLAAGLTATRGLAPELPFALALRLGLATASLAEQTEVVALDDRAHLTLAEVQDRQRLVRLVLTHWTAYLPTAPTDAAEWRALVAEPIIRAPVASTRRADAPPPAPPETRWRRALWDNLYPSIRQVPTPTQAIRRAAWHLRMQVRLDPPSAGHRTETSAPERWFDAWRIRQMSPAQFEYLLVAGLRSVGLPARLRPDGRAEHHVGPDWQLVWFDEGTSAANLATAPSPSAP